ncbi:MAG: PhnD/SsuA/transferrin family substrate-binding protein [Rhodocyclaceae bacterium]
MIRRRAFLSWLPLALASPRLLAAETRVRFGMTPAFLHDQHGLLADWRQYMEKRIGRRVEFVQRDSYRETMDLLRLEKIDFAWICDYPYVHLRKVVRLLAVPIYGGKPHYQAYLIVPASDVHTAELRQLKGRVFAYADPYSNTGYLAPRFQLKQQAEDPAQFFGKTFFTYSHRKLIDAVASGLAHGASVDSYVWDTLNRLKPEVTRRTRIVERSPAYGFPPLVAHRSVGQPLFLEMQQMLLSMKNDPEGQALLARLNLDGFGIEQDALYDPVAEMMRAFGEV